MQTCLCFDVLFGWRKASTCKKLVRRVQCRLKLLRCKRCSIVKHSGNDIAQLLQNGMLDSAFSLVEQLYKDRGLLAAYDLLDHFCEFLIIHFSYIRRRRVCTNSINEAISTLIFAAAWCGDLPELQLIRKLFEERYGRKFCAAAVELQPGNYVNNEMRENLCRTSISNEMKIKLINEVAKDRCIQFGNLERNSRLDTPLLVSNGNNECVLKAPENREPRVSYLESRGSCCEVSSQIQESTVRVKEVEEFRFNEQQDGFSEEKSVFLFNFINVGARMLILLRDDGVHYSQNPESRDGRPTSKCRSSRSISNYGCRFSSDPNDCFVHPCYLSTNCHEVVFGSPLWRQRRRSANYGVVEFQDDKEKMKKNKVLGQAVVSEYPDSFTSSIGSRSWGPSPCAEGERVVSIPADSRTMTVSCDSVKCRANEVILQPQSGSSPKGSSISSCKHVHPKLPDYDELAAKFRALKREHQQRNAAAMALAPTESHLH